MSSVSWTLAKITHGRLQKETQCPCGNSTLWQVSNIWFLVLKHTWPKRETEFFCLNIGVDYTSSVSWTLTKITHGRSQTETQWPCRNWTLWKVSNIWFLVLKNRWPTRRTTFLCLHIGIDPLGVFIAVILERAYVQVEILHFILVAIYIVCFNFSHGPLGAKRGKLRPIFFLSSCWDH